MFNKISNIHWQDEKKFDDAIKWLRKDPLHEAEVFLNANTKELFIKLYDNSDQHNIDRFSYKKLIPDDIFSMGEFHKSYNAEEIAKNLTYRFGSKTTEEIVEDCRKFSEREQCSIFQFYGV